MNGGNNREQCQCIYCTLYGFMSFFFLYEQFVHKFGMSEDGFLGLDQTNVLFASIAANGTRNGIQYCIYIYNHALLVAYIFKI